MENYPREEKIQEAIKGMEERDPELAAILKRHNLTQNTEEVANKPEEQGKEHQPSKHVPEKRVSGIERSLPVGDRD